LNTIWQISVKSLRVNFAYQPTNANQKVLEDDHVIFGAREADEQLVVQ
jgi:hypothetical protein